MVEHFFKSYVLQINYNDQNIPLRKNENHLLNARLMIVKDYDMIYDWEVSSLMDLLQKTYVHENLRSNTYFDGQIVIISVLQNCIEIILVRWVTLFLVFVYVFIQGRLSCRSALIFKICLSVSLLWKKTVFCKCSRRWPIISSIYFLKKANHSTYDFRMTIFCFIFQKVVVFIVYRQKGKNIIEAHCGWLLKIRNVIVIQELHESLGKIFSRSKLGSVAPAIFCVLL